MPVLVRRLVNKLRPGLRVEIPRPVRILKQRLLRPQEVERAVDLISRKAGPNCALPVLLDAEQDCPAVPAPQLPARVASAVAHVPSAVVLAKREFEAWFVAAVECLRGIRGIAAELSASPDQENIRGAQERPA